MVRDTEAWCAAVHGFAKSQTLLNNKNIANEQCCDGFRWPAKGRSHAYAGIHSPLNSPPIRAAASH